MQKLIGSACIILAGLGLGFSYGHELQKRLIDMREITHIFILIKGEIQYTRATLSDVFYRTAQRKDGVYKDWLMFLSRCLEDGSACRIKDVWEESINTYLKATQLKKSDIGAIKKIGADFGHMDVQTQISTIDLFLNEWEMKTTKAKEELSSKQKLSRCLGIMGGIMLVIFLV